MSQEQRRETRLRMLSAQVARPGGLRIIAAQQLLSEYTVAELGMALYVRCRRILERNTSARHRVMGSNPGRPNAKQRREINFLTAVSELSDEMEKHLA